MTQPETNALAYIAWGLVMKKKRFITLLWNFFVANGVVKKLFIVFIPGNWNQPDKHTSLFWLRASEKEEKNS